MSADRSATPNDAEPADATRPMDVEELLRVLPHLESAELMAISAAYRDADPDAREAARTAASAVARKRGLLNCLGRLQSSIIQWAGSDISRSNLFTFVDVSPAHQLLGDLRVEAVPPLLDAATAILLGPALDPGAREVLLEPWNAAIT